MQTVAAGIGADEHQLAARRTGGGRHELLAPGDAEAHRVDQWVAGVFGRDHDLAADGGDTEAVPVAADPGDHADAQPTVAGVFERAEAQRVEQRDRLRAHRKDVAHDPADAGRRALVGLDRARVVVGFDLHHGHAAVADVDRAGVFVAKRRQDSFALRGEVVEERAGMLVAAVLAPERADHAQLDLGRAAVEQLAGAVVLVAAQRDLRQRLVVGLGLARLSVGRRVGHAQAQPQRSMIERHSRLPSSPPSSGSDTRSGWGMMPSTLPAGLITPAMSWAEPLGLASPPSSPCSSQ